MNEAIKTMARTIVPQKIRKWTKSYIQKQWHTLSYTVGLSDQPPVGGVRWGRLRRLHPISDKFGEDRGVDGRKGLAIDRYYIERFLSRYSNDIKGCVLEFGDNHSTLQHGGDDVTKSEVLNVVDGFPLTTIVADIVSADDIPAETFDCIIMTHTIQMIYDQRAALTHLYRILKPGGVLLVNTHGTSKLGRHEDSDPWAVHWRMTTYSARRVFEEFFPSENVEVEGCGNVLVAIANLHGLDMSELTREELDYYDRSYQVVINVRAEKPQTS